jgi:hypothetical protein
MDNHIPLAHRKLLFVISRRRSVFPIRLDYIIKCVSYDRQRIHIAHDLCSFLLYPTVSVSFYGISISASYLKSICIETNVIIVGSAKTFGNECMYTYEYTFRTRECYHPTVDRVRMSMTYRRDLLPCVYIHMYVFTYWNFGSDAILDSPYFE